MLNTSICMNKKCIWNYKIKLQLIDKEKERKGKRKWQAIPRLIINICLIPPPPTPSKTPLTCTIVNGTMHSCTLLSTISQVIWIWPTNLVIQMKPTNFFSPAILKETVNIGTNEKFKILTHNVVVECNSIQNCTKIGFHVWKYCNCALNARTGWQAYQIESGLLVMFRNLIANKNLYYTEASHISHF